MLDRRPTLRVESTGYFTQILRLKEAARVNDPTACSCRCRN